MSDKRRFQGPSPERSATLANPSRVQRAARASLADLDDATAVLGEALVAAGLSRRVWRSEQATLRLLDGALPAITLGAFLARLDAFAARDGPALLRGTHDDLEVFLQEVGALQAVAQPLLVAVRRLQGAPPGEEGRNGWRPWRRPRPTSPLRVALRHPRVEAPLAAIAEILGSFEARAPLMMAVQAVQAVQPRDPGGPVSRDPDLATGPFPADAWLADDAPRTQRVAIASPSATPRAKAAALVGRILPTRGAVAAWLVGRMGRPGLRQRLAAWRRWLRGWRLAASVGIALAVAVAGSALVLGHRPPPAPARSSAPSAPSSPAVSLTALAGSATPPATGVPTPTVPPHSTAGLAPKLALSCMLQGATATLTLKNVGASPFTWQVHPPPPLTAVPVQGTLNVGQSTVVQVSAKNKKTATGTIRVVASHDSQSTEDSVSCH